MKVLSLFSGVGGFDLGLERAGMETVFQCEWDKHATKILERHWPEVPRWDDVSTLTGKHILNHAPVIDIVAWGSPCQDLSVAGKRAGLEGSRSGLFHEGIRIIKELRKETNNVYPRISLWENVYGALNSNKGADFGVILDEMAEAGSLVQEWRVLDAQYFGVPQRRRRVFLVSVFDTATAARCPDPLLPVSESMQRDTPTSRTPRQEPTRTTTQSLGSGSDIANTISASLYHHGTVVNQDANNGHVIVGENHARPVGTAVLGSEIIGSLNAVDYKWPQNQQLDENKFIPVETFTKAKRAQTTTDDETWVENKPAPTLNSFDQGDTRATTVVVEPVFFQMHQSGETRIQDGVMHTLAGYMGTGGNNTPMVAQAIPIQDGRDIEKHQNGLGIGEEGAPSYTLDQTGAQAVAYGIQGNVIGRQDHNGPGGKGHTEEGDPMFTLTGTDIHAVVTSTPMLSFDTKFGSNANVFENQSPTLKASQAAPSVAYTLRMREGKPGGGKGPLISEEKSLTLGASTNDQTIFQPAHTTAFQPGTMTRLGGGVWEELAPTLRAEAKRGDNEPHIAIQYAGYTHKINDTDIAQTLRLGRDSSDFVAQPVDAAGFKPGASSNARSIGYEEGLSPSLEGGGGGNNRPAVLESTMAVRRLTPIECERLMGWPDGWTEGQADTHRYKQCGNGVASPVATWIGQQLLQLDKEPDAPPTTTTT